MILVTPSSSILKARAGCSTSQSSLTPLISKLFSPLNYLNSNASIVAPPLAPSLPRSLHSPLFSPPSLLPLGEPRGQAQRYKRKLRSNERTALLAAERARDGRESIEREERSIRQPKSGGRSGKMKQQCLQGPEIRLVRGCKRFIHRPS